MRKFLRPRNVYKIGIHDVFMSLILNFLALRSDTLVLGAIMPHLYNTRPRERDIFCKRVAFMPSKS